MFRRMSRRFWSQGSIIAVIFLTATVCLAQQDFSKVEIKVTKVSGNIYMLEGSGGNIAASVGEDGIVIVDDQFAPLAEKIQAALTQHATEDQMLRIRREVDGQPTQYRRKMKAEQIALVERQYIQKRLLEEFGLPRLSLYYFS